MRKSIFYIIFQIKFNRMLYSSVVNDVGKRKQYADTLLLLRDDMLHLLISVLSILPAGGELLSFSIYV